MAGTRTINYAYAPLSDETVVRTLVEQREKLDPIRKASGTSLFEAAADTSPLVEDIICLYVDLDRLIEAVRFPSSEAFVLEKIMDGYTINDLSEIYGGSRQAYSGYYRRAIGKIVKESQEQWARHYGEGSAKTHPRFCV